MITDELRAEISSLSNTMQIQAWKNHFQINPFDLIREGMLFIKTDRQEIIRLVPNAVQIQLLDYVEDKWLNNKPCYIVVPKARRTGISTIVEAISYVLCSQRENSNAIIVANKLVNSDNIFDMTKLYHEKLYHEFKPTPKRSNKKELYFGDIHSIIVVDSAENKDVGQSWAFQIIHLSEVAYFNNPTKITTGLFQTLPDNMFVMVVLESTGNGIGGYFYDIVRGAEKGENDYKLFFFAWWQKPENTMPLTEPIKLESSGQFGNEVLIKSQYNLSDEQMNWRRFTIKNKCNNNLQTFMQEHPVNLDECFQASGVNAFDVEKLNLIEKDTKPYKWKGVLVEEDNKVIFREDINGWLLLWEKPELGWKYLYNLSLDTGGIWERTPKDCADWSVGIVRHRIKRCDVAQFHIHAPAHIVAERTVLLGRYYDNCQITPEINKWINETDDIGEPVLNILRDNYNNLYYRKTYDKKNHEWKKQLGFHTNKQTKKLLIQKTSEVIDNYSELREQINDIELVKEMKMYITNDDKGTYEATEGEKDDRVMSYSINLLTCDEMTAPKIIVKERISRNRNNERGVFSTL